MTAPAKIQANVVALFDREGAAPSAKVQYNEKGKPFFMQERKCARCGGAGKSDRWTYTGLVCYDCNGSGRHKNGPVAVRLYTVEQIAKLNVGRDKVRARKAAEEQAKREAFEKIAQENRATFQAQHGDLMKRGWAYLVARFGWDEEADEVAYEARGNFVFMIISKAERASQISQAQVDVIETEVNRWDALQAAKRASTWVGEIGETLTLTVEVVVTSSFERAKFNASWLDETVFIRVLRDEEGHTFKVMSTSFYPARGTKMVITGKVKSHETYKDEKQTVLNFVKIKKTIEVPQKDDDHD